MNAGASAYFAKPLDPEALRNGIERLLAAAERRNEAAEREVRAMLRAPEGGEALAGALAAGVDSQAAAEFEGAVNRRFIEAGGTRARFRSLLPRLLSQGAVASGGPEPRYLAAAAGGRR
jgi:hypothetical protein